MLIHKILSFIATTWYAALPVAAVAYLLGSISFAIIVTKRFSGKDIRDFGSGNAGATNVLRSQGKWPAAITAVGDLSKSLLSILIGRALFIQLLSADAPHAAYFGTVGAFTAGVFCIVGHLYPLYFGFRGGKGVITAFGMYLMLDWRVALVILGVFLITFGISRMVSLGSILGAITAPVVMAVFHAVVDHEPAIIVIFCTAVAVAVAVVLTIKHRTNIVRILNGTESKIYFSKLRR